MPHPHQPGRRGAGRAFRIGRNWLTSRRGARRPPAAAPRRRNLNPSYMKKYSRLSCLLGIFLLALAAQAGGPRYRLMWKDNFRGRTFNEKYWSKIPRGGSDWNRHMSAEASLYDVRRGRLVLRGVANDGRCPNDTAPFLTGGLYTRGKVNVRYGKVEIRARLHGAQGAWPAFWLLPEEGEWPRAGEIDIMERLNHDSIAYQTVHTYYTYVLGHDRNPPHGATGPIRPDRFNVYAVEILPDSLVFSINGRRTFAYPRLPAAEAGQYPFGTPFYLLIDMQLGGQWVGRVDPRQLPADLEVDWVKMYEWVP